MISMFRFFKREGLREYLPLALSAYLASSYIHIHPPMSAFDPICSVELGNTVPIRWWHPRVCSCRWPWMQHCWECCSWPQELLQTSGRSPCWATGINISWSSCTWSQRHWSSTYVVWGLGDIGEGWDRHFDGSGGFDWWIERKMWFVESVDWGGLDREEVVDTRKLCAAPAEIGPGPQRGILIGQKRIGVHLTYFVQRHE